VDIFPLNELIHEASSQIETALSSPALRLTHWRMQAVQIEHSANSPMRSLVVQHTVDPNPFQMSLICINDAGERTIYFLEADDRQRNLTKEENIMSRFYKKAMLICAAAAAGAVLCAMPISVEHSPMSGIVLSIDQAQARVGHPATPASAAGVHRRTTRRAVRHCAAGVTC
jgi:hypothetical protein